MTEKDEVFLLAKVNLLEALTADLLSVLAGMTAKLGRNDPRVVLETIEHNLTGSIAMGMRVGEGDVTRVDPQEVQTEMLRQAKVFFQRALEASDRYNRPGQ